MKTIIHRILSPLPALAALAFSLGLTPPARAFNFTGTGAMNLPRFIHTATLLTNGQVLVTGGFNTDIGVVAGTESYQPATGIWTTNGDLLVPHENHTATLLRNGRVLVAGGDSDTALNEAELFDPASGLWTVTGSMTNARTLHAACLLPNGQVLVTGGSDVNGALTTCELYDPPTGTWTNTGAMQTARLQHTTTLLNNGLVLVAGGSGDNTSELYNPATGIWTATGLMTAARMNATATLLPDGRVLVAGGSGDNTSELYNPATGTWIATGLMTASRVNATATLLPSGRVLVAGGYNASDTSIIFSSTELYNPATGTWSNDATMTSVRSQHTQTLLPNGNVLIAGGFDGNNGVAVAELYNSTAAALPIRFTTGPQPPGGAFQFGFTNLPGFSFTALASTNLQLPFADWTVAGNATEISSGVYQFTDPQATNSPQRFYRVRSP